MYACVYVYTYTEFLYVYLFVYTYIYIYPFICSLMLVPKSHDTSPKPCVLLKGLYHDALGRTNRQSHNMEVYKPMAGTTFLADI